VNLRISRQDGICVVRPESFSVTYKDLESMQEQLFGLIEEAVRHLVLDLSEVTTIDSFGVGVLMSAHRRMTKAGGVLKLAAVTPKLRSVMAITKVDTVVDLYPSVEEACRSFQGDG